MLEKGEEDRKKKVEGKRGSVRKRERGRGREKWKGEGQGKRKEKAT